MGIVGSFSGLKRLGREADISSPCSAAVKNVWYHNSTSLYIFMGLYLIKPSEIYYFLFRSGSGRKSALICDRLLTWIRFKCLPSFHMNSRVVKKV